MNNETDKSTIKSKSLYYTLIAIVGALYVVLVILIPIAWEIPQIRFADCLFSTVFFFGYPGAIGLAVGCVFANMVGGLGIIDVVCGSLANLLAGLVGFYLYRKIKEFEGVKKHIYVQLILLLMNVINTLIVGSYLPLILPYPTTYLICYVGIFTGSLISMNLCGYLLYIGLEKAGLEKYLTLDI